MTSIILIGRISQICRAILRVYRKCATLTARNIDVYEAMSHNDWQARLAVLDDKYNLNECFGDWWEWLSDCGDVYSHRAVGF